MLTALAFLSLLLLFLCALLDGLFLGSTGAIRSQPGEVIVYSSSSGDSFFRSVITPDLRAKVAAIPGVDTVGGLGVTLTTAEMSNEDEVIDVAVIGFELPPKGMAKLLPRDGEAYGDRRLEGFGIRKGQTLAVGLGKANVKIIGWVNDTSYQLQGALWTTPETWRLIAGSVPDRFVPEGDFQALVVQRSPVAPGAETAVGAIDSQTDGATS